MARNLIPPKAPAVRFRIEPAYAPREKVARLLHLTEPQFRECASKLYARGFPLPDETTGMYHLEAIDRWSKRKRPDLFPETGFPVPTPEPPPRVDLGAKAREMYEAEQRRRAEILAQRRRKS
ncbi:hypothetical protein [Methylorubrum extorquens]|uniref:Uncharacterized protein n=1 Tax=Methylorubrum extorquens (strain ATCC 14718 / DSM 1338 / JCM 2805 / NCIMB 9133 / AM1) TaxID=272630 RepID=C5B6W1_METEA|nr:hypothetical protein [Methylorubrum extorquens]ACS44193.1 Hypothetical protein MexAM1_p3METAp0018 [Methylorubrum extorquens AM1]MCP1591988.1 hypothetical protein [Methylorubrum extorquens]